MLQNRSTEDVEFARSCVSGDPYAWDMFVERYVKLIYSAVYATVRLKGQESRASDFVKDICQDIFAFLQKDNCKKLRTYQGKNGCSLASWLRLVTVRQTIDYLRRQKKDISLDASDDEGKSLADFLAACGISARDSLIKKDLYGHLSTCIDKLPIDDKYCVELLFYQRLLPEEVGQTLGISRQAVDMRKMRLLAKLRECFQKKGLLDL